MSLLETILGAGGGKGPAQLAQQFGLSENQVGSALKSLMPALNAGMKKNTAAPGGLDGLMGALKKGNHAQYIDQPELLGQQSTVDDGNKILGHLLGGKEQSRQVAANAAAQTGIDQGILKKMLPLAASMMMGGVAKNQNNLLGGGGGADAGGLLGKFLDADGDGSIADDLVGKLGKMF